MLIDINLLPAKDKKNKSLLWLAGISVGILLIGGSFIFWLNGSLTNKLSAIQEQIAITEELVAIEQQKMTSYQSSDSLSQLEQTVKWAKEYPIKTIPVLQELTELLPERGFIQTFSYDETGTVQLSVQFESTREAAYYLSSLHQSNWIQSAVLNNVNASHQQLDEEETSERYVPRYIADFSIALNKDVVKAGEEQPSSEEKEEEDS